MPEARTSVSIVKIDGDLKRAVSRVMDDHGVASVIARKPREVYIKVNAIDGKPYTYTSIEVTGEVIDYCRRSGAERVFLMENSTQSNITRLVFRVAGFDRLARERGATPLYLDEGRQVAVTLPHMGYDVHVSEHVKHIIDNRDDVCYVNVPRLKTHSMAVITGGIKNQYGLIMHADRSRDHNFKLARKLADIYSIIQPDFTLVDGTVATIYGHYPTLALHEQSLVPFDILVGGPDTLAVDTVCARIFGYPVEEVPHLKEARDMDLGCADLEGIEVLGESLDRFREKYPYRLYDAFPPDVNIIRGTERNCLEGCDANTMGALQLLYMDHGGKGGFTVVMGKGLDRREIDAIEGRVFVAGMCADEEVRGLLESRLGRKNVFGTNECNDLAGITYGIGRLMKVDPLKLVPVNPVTSLGLLVRAKINRTTARIPPLLPF